MKLVNIARFRQEKIYAHKYIYLAIEAYEEYFKTSFSGGGVLLNSIMDIHCSTAEGEADQNRMAVDVRGGAVNFFQNYLRQLFIDFEFTFCCWFTSHILFCFCFVFSNIWENILTYIMWVIQEVCY